MEKKTYRRFLIAAILLVGLLPVLGHYAAELIVSLNAGNFIGKDNLQAIELLNSSGWRRILRGVLVEGPCQFACAAGFLLCLLTSLRCGFKKSIPFLSLTLIGPALPDILTVMSWIFRAPLPSISGLMPRRGIDFTMLREASRFIPMEILPFLGVLAACILAAYWRLRPGAEWKQFLCLAGVAAALPLLMGLLLVFLERTLFPELYYANIYPRVAVWTVIRGAAAVGVYFAVRGVKAHRGRAPSVAAKELEEND